MVKIYRWLFLLPWLVYPLKGQGIDPLVQPAGDYIRNFFSKQYQIRFAVTRLENYSSLSTPGLERLYQLIYAKVGNFNDNQFLDLLIDFQEGKPRFNTSESKNLDYLLYLKFIQNRTKIGVGVVIFSRRLNQIVGINYFESTLSEPERNLLEIREFGFSELGFSKLVEIEAKKDLMDVKSLEQNGVPYIYMFYPRSIVSFRATEPGLEKSMEWKLNWPPPLYPVLHYEGRLSFFFHKNRLYLSAGSNFSPQSLLFSQDGEQWQPGNNLPFVPFASVSLNQTPYLLGGVYQTGKNLFQDSLRLLPLSDDEWNPKNILEKKVPVFFSLDVEIRDGELYTVHLIDHAYQYRCYAADFSTEIAEFPKKGASLAVLHNRWVVTSDYSQGSDRLFFFQSGSSALKLTYENALEGEVLFLSPGTWQGAVGCWAYIQIEKAGFTQYILQFWGKKSE